MATKFNLTAQLQLQAPRNTAQVVSQIQRQLSGVNVPVNVVNSSRATQQLKQINNQTKKVTTQAQKMGKAFGVATRRFAAFTVAARGITLFTTSLANAVDESIQFQRELIKISQVTGKSISELRSLSNTISDLSTSLGVSSKSLLSTGRILSQAGIQAKELEIALSALAKTTLAPTFDDITKTTEGAVAIIAQFKEGVGALERQLGSINAVAGQFAVESGDLISAVRRTGGVFKAAGGDLEELLALFTSVRATTRESAESIATGLRTIFTRIQRPRTIEFLKQYGVELTDLEGKFVGPFEAVRRLSLAFADLEEGDVTFVKVAEELGGFRQIGKVIPLIKEFSTAEKARQAAIAGGESLTKDAAAAQLALAVQFQKVKEEFYELIRAITETSTFQALVKTSLNLASALIKVADAIKPLIPLIGAFAAFKVAKGLGGFAAGIGAGLRGTKGFNAGGLVPGSGNRDTVPAMLTPGEFVIRKSSVKSLGVGTLAAMNNNRYADGGFITTRRLKSAQGGITIGNKQSVSRNLGWSLSDAFKVPFVTNNINPLKDKSISRKLKNQYKNATSASKRGFIFEDIIAKKFKRKKQPNNAFLDVKNGEIKSDKKFLPNKSGSLPTPAYATLVAKTLNTILKTSKVKTLGFTPETDKIDLSNFMSAKSLTLFRDTGIEDWEKRATGGGISGSDTVPALLTPGEFVINKKAASQIGAANLNRMNTKGVQGFARGGFVGVQKFAKGGGAAPSKAAGDAAGGLANVATAGFIVSSVFESMRPTIDENSTAMEKLTDTVLGTASQIAVFGTLAAGILPKGSLKAAKDLIIPSSGKANLSTKQNNQRTKANKEIQNLSVDIKSLQDGIKADKKAQEVSRKSIDKLTKRIEDNTKRRSELNKKIAETRGKGGRKGRAQREAALNERIKVEEQLDRDKGKLASAQAAGTDEKLEKSILEKENTVREKDRRRERVRRNKQNVTKKGLNPTQRAFNIQTERGILRGADRIKGVGKGVSRFGRKVGRKGGLIGKAAGGLISRGGAAISGGGTALAGSSTALAGAATAATTALASFTAGAGIAIGATAALSSALDSLTGVHEKAKKAIEDGNTEAAGAAAVNSQLQKDANKAALGMAAVGAAVGQVLIPIPVLGAAIGGLVGGVVGLAAKLPGVNKIFGALRNSSIGKFFGAESTSLIAARAKVEAQAVKNQKEFVDNAKEATRAMQDVENGSKTLKEAFESGALTMNARNQASLAVSQRDVAVQTARESKSGFSATLAAIPVVGGLLGTSSAEQDKQIEEKSKKAEEEKRQALNKIIDENSKLFNDYGRNLITTGDASTATLANFKEEVANQLGVSVDEIDPKTLADLEAKFVRNAKEVAANTRAFAASNVGLQGFSNFANGASAEIGKISSVLNGSFNSVKSSSDLLAASLSGAQVSDKSFNNALDNLVAGFEDFGIEEQSINKIKGNVTALRGVTGNFNEAVGKVAQEVAGGDIKPTQFKDKILDALVESAPKGQEKFIKDFFGNIEFDPKDIEKSLKGDFSGIMKTLGDQAGEGFKEVQEASQAVSSAQQALVDVTRQRIQVERQFVEAQKENIGLQQEAAQALSDFGIDTLDTSEKVEFAQKKLAASFDGRTFGGAGDIQNEIRSIQARATGAIQQNRGALTGTGPQGTDFAANTDLIAKSQDQLNATIEYSRARIALYKEELDIVRKKNQAEKDSLDSLLSGDIEGFIQGQQQSAAAAALRSGDATAASLFGSKALGGALKDLREQGLSGAELERASSLALGSVGIQDQTSAQVLAGTTDEERAIMAGVESEAESLRVAGAAKEALAGEQLTTAKLGETQAVNALKEAQLKAAEAAENFARSLEIANEAANKREAIADKAEQDNVTNIQARANEEKMARAKEAKEIESERKSRLIGAGKKAAFGGIFGAASAAFDIMGESGKREEENKRLAAMQEEQKKADERLQDDLDRARQSYRRGGLVYAKNGFYAGASNMFKNIFKSRGVDRIPAMVQPGEFIMSKKGVQSGNNLGMLKAMNQGLSGLMGGGLGGIENIGAMLKDGASTLMKPAESIMHAAEQLKNTFANTNIGMNVSPFNVNVNFNGASFLEGLTEDIKSKVMTEVVEEMKKMSFDNSGNSIRKKGVL